MKNHRPVNFFLALLCLFQMAPASADFDQEQTRAQVLQEIEESRRGDNDPPRDKES